MARIGLDVDTWVTREAEDDGWDKGDRDGSVGEPYLVLNAYQNSYRGVDTDLEPPFYVVYAGYYTGSTFGRDYDGTVVGVVKTEEEAYSLRDTAKSAKGFTFEWGGREFYLPWNGYFEHLDDVRISRIA